MKGLRKKITCVVVVPCIIGLILSWFSSIGYIYLTYSSYLDNYTDKMLSNQKDALLSGSILLAKCSSLSYVQKILDLVNIGSDFMESYLFYGMIVNTNLTTSKLYRNFNINSKSPDYDPNISVWYYENIDYEQNLSSECFDDLTDASYYNSIIDPVTSIAGILGKLYKITYVSFNNGLVYSNPAANSSFNQINTCPSTNNTCECNPYTNISYYDPRCRSYYQQVENAKTSDAILTRPYLFTDGTRGQSACRGIWNYTTTEMLLVYCVDFQMSNFFEISIVNVERNDVSYSFILDTDESVLAYKNYEQSEISGKTITDLEFPHDVNSKETKKEIKDFKKNIITLLTNQTSKVTSFTRYNKKMIIAVSPITMQMSSEGQVNHVASVALVMKKSYIESKFNKLKSNCNDILSINLIIQVVLLFFILIFCIFVTHKLSGQIIRPIDHLLSILKRLKEGDLSVDILNSFQASPPEVTCLYKVFDELRVVLRFSQIDKEKMTEATLIYSQASNLFKKFGNERALEICYRELGYICYKKKMWIESGKYLYKALRLALKLEIYDEYEIARIKTDAATALVKTQGRRAKGLEIFNEALDTFNQGMHCTDVVIAMIEIAQSLEGTGELNIQFLNFIEEKLENSLVEERDLLYQKFLYIKADYYKSKGNYKQAVKLIQRVLEDYSEFLPEIWIKSADLLIEILTKFQINPIDILQLKQQRKILKKDIVLIISDNLIPSSISWAAHALLMSVLDPADRISILQFSNYPITIYTLSKIPVKLINLEKKLEKSSQASVFDCVQEGLKQLRISNLTRKDERKSWVIIITDSQDNGSAISHDELMKNLNEADVGVVLIRCFIRDMIFDSSLLENRDYNEFFISSEDNASMIFKEIEVFLCPYKEVFM